MSFLSKSCFFFAFTGVTICSVSVQSNPVKNNWPLNVTFGSNGIQTISYRGHLLEDVEKNPEDTFHIWHLKTRSLSGKILSDGDYGWGENSKQKIWNPTNNSWNYLFSWGSIHVEFKQELTSLNVCVKEINNPDSGVILQGASIFPFSVHFPSNPKGFADPAHPQFSENLTGPGLMSADYGSGSVVSVIPNSDKPLYSGFFPAKEKNTYFVIVSSTAPEGLATFRPHADRTTLPGNSDQFCVSFRFEDPGTPMSVFARDAYKDWTANWPAALAWQDRRIIGTAYLASSPAGDANLPGGYSKNPRRYFNDDHASTLDVTTPDGLALFQTRILDKAKEIVRNLRKLDAQGVITWDIEGEEYPQETSYVCAPDQISTVSPEMESIVRNKGSEYFGMKIDDAYFKIIRDAGFRVGVCIRPQHFFLHPDKRAEQKILPVQQVTEELLKKIKFAHDRWGATIFYLDSTVDLGSTILDASIMQKVAAAYPDSLLIPEESTPKFYAYTAPFKTFLFHGELGTDTNTYFFYPHAFSANLINDSATDKLFAAKRDLIQAVSRGDVLMVHADFWHPNNSIVQEIYSLSKDQNKK